MVHGFILSKYPFVGLENYETIHFHVWNFIFIDSVVKIIMPPITASLDVAKILHTFLIIGFKKSSATC